MKIRAKLLAIALLSTAAATPLRAQEVDTLPRYRLEGVTVTTPRGAVDRTLATQRVDVVTRTDLQRAGAVDLGDALRSSTPLDVISYPGLLTGVSIRGFRPQLSGVNPRTLVLVDGRPAGTSNLALIHAGGVERIEVQRGPGSALYGSSAMGGVVNVVTRRSAGPLGGRLESRYGSYGVYGVEAAAGGKVTERADFDVSATAAGQLSGYRTGSHRTFGGGELTKVGDDGTIASLPRVPADTLVPFTEYRTLGGRARLGYAVGHGWRLDATGEAFGADGVQNPGDLNPQEWDSRSVKDVYRRSFDLAVSGDLERYTPALRLFTTREANDYFNAPEAPHFVNFRTPTRTMGVQLQNGVRLGGHSLTLGTDLTSVVAISEAFSADGVRAAPYNPDSSIRSAAAFGQGRLRLLDSRLIVTGGVRADRVAFEVLETPHLSGYPPNREAHTAVSPNLGARLAVRPWLQLYGNAGRAFVAPEAFAVAGYAEQRAGPERSAVFVTRGNPGLRPETSWTWDMGLAVVARGGIDADLGYFETRVADRISTHLLPPAGSATPSLNEAGDTILAVTTYRNVDDARIRGLEGRVSYDVGRALGSPRLVRLFATGTRLLRADERVVESGATRRILNVADLTLIAGVDFDDLGRVSGRLAGRYVGEREDTDYVAWWAPGRITYPAHLVLDLTGRVRLGDRYAIGLEVRNLADEDYFEVRGYNLPGRSIRAIASLDF